MLKSMRSVLLGFTALLMTAGCGPIDLPSQQLAAPCITANCAETQWEHWGDVIGTQGYKISTYDNIIGERTNLARQYFNDRGLREMREGDRGDRGPQGERGADGNTGAAGQNGARGETGATGSTGATGASGADGAKGDTGDAGADGEAGQDGADGARGPRGRPGSPGEQGETGEGCYFDEDNYRYTRRHITYDVYIVCGESRKFLMKVRQEREDD